jgi:multiple sugar transport system permease protein
MKFKHRLILPAMLAMLMVMVFPLLYSLRTSLYHYVLSKPFYRPFVWFENYKLVLTDPTMHSSIVVTLKFAFGALLVELFIGFVLAYCLWIVPRFNNIIVSVLMVPMMITSVAVGLIWRLLLHPDLGIINYILDVIGIGGRAWLGLTSTALPTVIFIEAWQSTPFVVILIYAALISLPIEPYEAATIDGASGFQKLRYLTLPMLRPVLVVIGTLQLIYLLRAYDLIYLLTRGGPGTSTDVISYYIFRLGFTKVNMGQAAAASFFIVIAIGLATTFLFFRLKGTTET